jgi:hypothetical protein
MHEGTDQGTDPGEDGRWLTYRELAESRQIDRHSAVKLALKHGWRRQRDNHNVLRILVPVEWLAPRGRGMPKATDAAMPQGMPEGMAQGTDFTHAINAFDAALTALREQLERSEQGREAERARAERLDLLIETERGRVLAVEAKTVAADQRADHAQAAVRDLRAHAAALQAELAEAKAAVEGADELRAQVEALNRQLAAAQAATQAVEAVKAAETERQARGLLARLRAAVRGR